MFKKMLVPLDGSDQAERIGSWASGLARSLGTEVVLLSVVNPDDLDLPEYSPEHTRVGGTSAGAGPYDRPEAEGNRDSFDRGPGDAWATGTAPQSAVSYYAPERHSPGYGTQLIDEEMEMARRYLKGEADRLALSGVKAEAHVTAGDPSEEIVNSARRLGADIIAMATRRESVLARGVLGSVTDRVLHKSPVPVLAIHPERDGGFLGNAGAPDQIIVPLDGSELSEQAVPLAEGIASAVGAKIVFLQSTSRGSGETASYPRSNFDGNEKRMDALGYLDSFVEAAQRKGIEAEARAMRRDAAHSIIDAASESQGSMIVMSTHGRSGISRFFLGSVTDKIIRSSGYPVLVVRPEEQM